MQKIDRNTNTLFRMIVSFSVVMTGIRAKLSFLIMKKSASKETMEDDLNGIVRRYSIGLIQSKSRLAAVEMRDKALNDLDEWRREQIEEIEDRVRSAGRKILRTFDQCLSIENLVF